jgi:hypothetical protein
MNIVEILIKREDFTDGTPGLACWVRTDHPNVDGNSEFACGLPWRPEGEPLGNTGEILRWMAACIESMSVRPRPNLKIVNNG